RLLNLNPTQQGVLSLVFKVADDRGLLLLDLKDLRAMLQHVGTNARQFTTEYGNVSAASIGAIQRAVLEIDQQGGEAFLGEPMLDIDDLLQTDSKGRGVVNVLVADQLVQQPKLYATFLLWMLSELYERLPEIGDPEKPTLVFFFDEAHLLFDGASKAFLQAIAQTVRLVRSKGVGVFFVTQTPKDVPGDVLAQLGNRVQHALRAFTPDDAKALKATVSTFPHSPYDLEELLTQLGIGEAVITVLSDRGAPTPVAWTRLRAPQTRMAPTDPATVTEIIDGSSLKAQYAEAVDRDSAYERLAAKLAPPPAPAGPAPAEPEAPAKQREPRPPSQPTRDEESALEKAVRSPAAKQFARSAAAVLGREITRSIFGTSRRRRR
ncbi:MAG: double-strand break repair helicase HerA and related ATPase, partial [Actinomycetota bacterium]|nr:double-strand break repair helicase HerA and related ATPase [Actinomycetota bacterium]